MGGVHPIASDGAHQTVGLDLHRPAVDEVADRDGLPVGMAPAFRIPLVAHPLEQLLQPTGVSMNIADDVVHALLPGRSSNSPY